MAGKTKKDNRYYGDQFKNCVVEYAKQCGRKKASEDLGVPYSTLVGWMQVAEKNASDIRADIAESEVSEQQNGISEIKDMLTALDKRISLIEDRQKHSCLELSEKIDNMLRDPKIGKKQKSVSVRSAGSPDEDAVGHEMLDTVAEKLETMNKLMQEIMGELMSLDEANRLIIARLLLKDLEI